MDKELMTTGSLTPTEVGDKIRKTISVIDTKLSTFKELESSQFKTNGNFSWSNDLNDSYQVNIHECEELDALLIIYSELNSKKINYEESAKELSIKEFPTMKWQSTLVENWLHDLQIRIKMIQHHAVKEKLEADKEELQSYLSQTDRARMVLEKMKYLEDG